MAEKKKGRGAITYVEPSGYFPADIMKEMQEKIKAREKEIKAKEKAKKQK